MRAIKYKYSRNSVVPLVHCAGRLSELVHFGPFCGGHSLAFSCWSLGPLACAPIPCCVADRLAAPYDEDRGNERHRTERWGGGGGGGAISIAPLPPPLPLHLPSNTPLSLDRIVHDAALGRASIVAALFLAVTPYLWAFEGDPRDRFGCLQGPLHGESWICAVLADFVSALSLTHNITTSTQPFWFDRLRVFFTPGTPLSKQSHYERIRYELMGFAMAEWVLGRPLRLDGPSRARGRSSNLRATAAFACQSTPGRRARHHRASCEARMGRLRFQFRSWPCKPSHRGPQGRTHSVVHAALQPYPRQSARHRRGGALTQLGKQDRRR